MGMSNRSTRIIVSLLSIPAILAVCYYGEIFFLVFTLGIGLIGFFEFAEMVKNIDDAVNKLIGLCSVAALILNEYFNFIDSRSLAIIISITLLSVELFRNKKSPISNLGSTFLGIFYIGLFSAAILNIREIYGQNSIVYVNGGMIIISLLISIWVCDSAAYFLGSAFGKHKLFPRVSPNKSWEGAIAGFIFSIIAMVALKSFLIDFLIWQDVIILGIIVGVIGQMGDLVESLIKRDAGVKDSSALIPGHGGIFDRFDSLLFTAPFVYLYLNHFVV